MTQPSFATPEVFERLPPFEDINLLTLDPADIRILLERALP
jgi:hypothetical protein